MPVTAIIAILVSVTMSAVAQIALKTGMAHKEAVKTSPARRVQTDMANSPETGMGVSQNQIITILQKP